MLVILGVALQVGLLACGGSGSEETSKSSITPEASDHLGRAQRLLRDGALRAALAHTDTAATLDGDAADVYFLRGRIFSRLNRYDEANAAYEKALSLDPNRQGAWFNIGNNFFRRGQFRKALNHYVKEETNHPTPSLYVHMGQAYSNLGKVDSALYAYNQALAMDSSFARAYAWLGQFYSEEGEFQKALAHTERAVKHDSANLKYRYFLGNLLLKNNRAEAAVDHLRRVIREQPWHYAAHYNLGQAYARLNLQEEAQKHFTRADSLQKKMAEIERLQALAQEHSDQPRRWIDLAEALQDIGRFARAKEAYSVALSLAPRSVAIRNNLANIALALGDTTEAIGRYRRILESDSAHANVWLNLGVVYAKTGRREKAIEAWKQALRYEPDHPTAKAYLAKLSE